MADKRKKSTLKDAEDCQDTPEPEPEPEPVYGNGTFSFVDGSIYGVAFFVAATHPPSF